MNIEAIMKKYERLIPAGAYTLGEGIRAALTELSETHAIELRAYEATVENLEAKIARLTTGLDEITGLSINLRHGGCDSSDLRGLEEGLTHAIDIAYEMLSMLAAPQQKKEGE